MENTGKKYNDMLIRNFDASYLYWQIKDNALISEYLDAKKQLKETDTPELKQKVESLHNQIWSFNKDITLPKKDTRYLYSGTITDSLMSRHLRELVKDSSDAIRTVSGVDYTDVIINIKFKSDVYIKTDENKNIYNKDTGLVEQLDEKKSKRLITKTELRKMAYANGVTINGIHYVNFQRTSSKARTGNCLFIDEKYFAEMESWQTLGIPFREKFAKDEKIDIVSTRSYESLTSSSIIGTLDIDESQYIPFFFSWLDDTRQFIQEYEENTEIYRNRHGKYLDMEELDEEEMSLYYRMGGDTNPLAMKKLMWRRMKIANIGIEKFRQEYPTTASESFLVSGNNVFSLEKIQARTNNIYDSKPLSQKNIKNLSPLMKKWKKDWDMWREPKPKERFYAGVDTGEGIGSDNSVIEIVDQNGIQVFEFASNKIKPYEFADLVREVGNYYGTALLVVEKLSAGHTVVDKLYDGSHRYIRLYKYKEYDAKGKARKKPGFQTSSKSRPIIINRFVEMFETGQILLNSKKLLDEMKAFQLDDTGKQQAVKGAKDDRVMAFAMALEGLVNGIWYI